MVLIRFSRGSGLAGALVRWGTFSPFSHVGFRLNDGMVLDATPEFGVSIREAVDDETTQYFKPLVPAYSVHKAVEFARQQVGKEYDWRSIAGFVLRRDWHRPDKWFCSELVVAAFDYAEWPLIRDSGEMDRITPRDLHLSERIARVANP